MTFAQDVAWMCAEAPNAVDVRNAHGQRSRGPRRQMDMDRSDGEGLSRLVPVTVVSVPAAHLSRTDVDELLTVTDDAGTETSYRVRDIQLIEDGAVKRLVVVAA